DVCQTTEGDTGGELRGDSGEAAADGPAGDQAWAGGAVGLGRPGHLLPDLPGEPAPSGVPALSPWSLRGRSRSVRQGQQPDDRLARWARSRRRDEPVPR